MELVLLLLKAIGLYLVLVYRSLEVNLVPISLVPIVNNYQFIHIIKL